MISSIIHRYNRTLLFFQRDFSRTFESSIEIHKDQHTIWIAILFSIGVGSFFSLSEDPSLHSLWITLVSGVIYGFFLRYLNPHKVSHSLKHCDGFSLQDLLRIVLKGIFWMSLGFSAALIRTESLKTPMLREPLSNINLTGHIQKIEMHPSGLRLTIHPHNLKLDKIRITVKRDYLPAIPLHVDDTIETIVNLFPASPPVHPNGYDFQRANYFAGIGAVGYSTNKLIIQNSRSNHWLKKSVYTTQASIRTHLKKDLSYTNAMVALALTIGDKGGISKKLRTSYANAGIAHLLAISGLHLSIVAGFIFLLVRRILCFFPSIVLQHDIKKWAVLIAFTVISFYIFLCWGSISALRAYIMTSIIFLAVLLDRQAITFRNLALAALGILIVWPESLLAPSFQLSFAAVAGMIGFYQIFQAQRSDQIKMKFIYFLGGLLLSTVTATIATTPFTIYHFQQFSIHGLWVNLVAIPWVTFLLMPLLFMYLISIPLGIQKIVALPLDIAIEGLNFIALYVNELPGANLIMPPIKTSTAIIMTCSLLWMILWRNRLHYISYVGLAFCLFQELFIERAIGVIDFERNFLAYKNGDKLMISHKRENFIQDQWQLYTQTHIKKIIPCRSRVCHKKWAGYKISWDKKGLKHPFNVVDQDTYFVISIKNGQYKISEHFKTNNRVWSHKGSQNNDQ